MPRWLVLLPIAILACKNEPAQAPAREPAGGSAGVQAEAEARAKARAAGLAACDKAKDDQTVFHWIHDDYPAALACAKATDRPIVLDLWAPWCHTCLSMQSTVFTDRALATSSFVFAALDTDREVNAAAVAKFPPAAWPTFYVVSPNEEVLARFVGAASVAQFHAFLDAGKTAWAGRVGGVEARLLAAERALAAKDYATAEKELTAALEAAPAGWVRRPDALVSLIGAKSRRDDLVGCVELAEQRMGDTGSSASVTDFLYYAMTCGKELAEPKGGAAKPDPQVAARVKKLREAAVARWQRLLEDPGAQLSVDDRSDAMMNLRQVLVELGRKADAKALAERQRQLLDDAAAKAKAPIAAMTYNWPRAEVYAFLERPLELVPALEKSVRELPEEYDPPARLGWIYWKGGKLDEAVRWTDAALKLVYGPRKERVLIQRAEIAKEQGDRDGERAARAEIVKTLEGLPAGQASAEKIAKARQALAELER